MLLKIQVITRSEKSKSSNKPLLTFKLIIKVQQITMYKKKSKEKNVGTKTRRKHYCYEKS